MRPTDVPDQGLLCDLLWSDPDKDVQGWGENDRGAPPACAARLRRGAACVGGPVPRALAPPSCPTGVVSSHVSPEPRPSPGVSYTFGADVVAKFLDKHDLDLVCRAHQARLHVT